MLARIAQLQAKTWHKFEYDAGIDLELLDDVVAVARLLRDQGKRDQPEIALRQHASGPHEVGASGRAHAASRRNGLSRVVPSVSSRTSNSLLFSKIYLRLGSFCRNCPGC
jgi:hypothetical protein